MKKILTAVIIAMIAGTFTACGDSQTDTSSEIKTEISDETTQEVQAAGADLSSEKSDSESTAENNSDDSVVSENADSSDDNSVSSDGNGITEPTYIDGILIANKTYALPSDYAPGTDSQALAAFDEMQKAAYADGCNIYISSGYRSYERQVEIYNRYVKQDGVEAADTYSSRPGHSEHQTGLTFDLNSIDVSFADTPEGKWVADNCYKYGFIVRYPEGKEDITGYTYEPWHIRYLGVEKATAVYESGLCLEEYLGITSSYEDAEKLQSGQ